MVRLIFTVFLLQISHTVFADTIWCKMFNTGCLTEEQKQEQKQKQLNYCEKMGNGAYNQYLDKALADPTLWQLAGERSAQDYAEGRRSLRIHVCLKMSTPQSF